jgi:hypothetical protein
LTQKKKYDRILKSRLTAWWKTNEWH